MNDPRVQWHEVSSLAIQVREGDPGYWEAGHVNSVLVADNGSLLVGCQSSGVWSITYDGGSALQLSDGWTSDPTVNAMAYGPDGDTHVFAGGTSLWVTDTASPVPLLNWIRVASLDSMNPGTIWAVVVVKALRRVVVATDNGVLWSPIPNRQLGCGCLGFLLGLAPVRRPPPGDGFVWRRAAGTGASGAMWSLTETVRGDAEFPDQPNQVLVGGGYRFGGESNPGLFFGFWDSWDTLWFTRPRKTRSAALLDLGTTSVASCPGDRRFVYAVSATAAGTTAGALVSTNGGQDWAACGDRVDGTTSTLGQVAGKQGANWNNCIDVDPANPYRVAFGWQNGLFTSKNGGASWSVAPGAAHADRHAVAFVPPGAARYLQVSTDRMYVGSDGGVVSTDDFGANYDSSFNRQLRNLQFYGPLGARQTWGSFGGFAQYPGLVGGGTQDNGCLYAELDAGPGPWRHLTDYDGGFVTCMTTGWVLTTVGLQPTPQPVTTARWDPGAHVFVDKRTPPLFAKGATTPDPAGLVSAQSIEATPRAKRKQGDKLLRAVASNSNGVYGLFALGGGDAEWHWLGDTPAPCWAVCHLDGDDILVGTSDRRIYLLNPVNHALTEYLYGPTLPASGNIFRFVPLRRDRILAILDWGTGGSVIRSTGVTWDKVTVTAGDPTIWGLEQAFVEGRPVLFAATETGVWSSYDEGDSWEPASQGLPGYPWCAELRYVGDAKQGTLYLSTFGRSAWKASLTRG